MTPPGWKGFFNKASIIHSYTQLCRLLAYLLNSLRLRPYPNIEKALVKATTASNIYGREKALALLSASVKANNSTINQLFPHQLGHDRPYITALHLAVYHHDLQAIEILLEHNASALIYDDDGYTAFHIAIQEAIKLNYMANTEDRKTMLDIITKLIQDQPSVIDSREETLNQTALHIAAKAGDHEVALLLINQGADVNCVDSDNNTPLHSGQLDIALIKATITSNIYGREKALDLLSASVKANNSTINQLFPHQLGHDRPYITALHLAVYHHDLQAIEILLEHNASALIYDDDGYTAFHIAIQEAIKLNYMANTEDRKTMLDIITKLIQDQPSVIDSREETLNQTALHIAAKAGDHEVALLLINQGADVNCVDSDNNTPLHSGQLDIALIKATITSNIYGREKALDLLSASVKANNSTINQHFLHQLGHDRPYITALHLAVYHHDLQAIEILLEHNASALIYDDDGYTAFHIAIQEAIKLNYMANTEDRKTMLDIITKLIQDQPSVIDSQEETLNQTALHIAAKAGDHEVALLLINQGADVNCVDSVNNTPLHYTAMRLDNPNAQALHSGQLEIAKALIAKGCHTEIRNKHGSQMGATVLEEAKHTGNTAMAGLLSGPRK